MNDVVEFSHSESARWRRCRRSWWLEYHRKLAPKRFYPSAANLGSLFHMMVEDWRNGKDPKERARAYFDGRQAEMEEMYHSEHEKNWRFAETMFDGFVEWWDEEAMDHDWERLSSEEKLKMTLTTVVLDDGSMKLVVFKGKIDERVLNRGTGEITYIDWKTVGNFIDIIKRAPRDEQFLGYELLLRANYPDKTSNGGMWVMARKVLRGKTAKPPFYDTHTVTFNRHQLQNHQTRLVALANEIVKTRAALDAGGDHQTLVPPTPHKDCDWDCDFKHVCPSFDDGSRAEDMLTDRFVSINPYQRYEEEDE